MKLVVTGAAGFIGSHLCDRLVADGHEVVGLDDLSTGRLANLATARKAKSFSFSNLDITRPELVDLVAKERPGAVLHLAAQMDVRKSVADPLHDSRTNVLGTVNVLEACVRAAVPRVVFASSGGTVYGAPPKLPASERMTLHPASPYGAAKAAGESYLGAYQRLYGLAGCALRLGNVYGPRQDPHGEAGVVSIFAGALVRGEPTKVFGDGTSTRDYVYVDDGVDAFLRCLGGKGDGRRLNIASGTGTTVRQLHTAVARVVGAPDAPDFAPPRTGELHAVVLDVGQARRALGWEPAVGLEQGLAQTVDWIRSGKH